MIVVKITELEYMYILIGRFNTKYSSYVEVSYKDGQLNQDVKYNFIPVGSARDFYRILAVFKSAFVQDKLKKKKEETDASS